MKFCRKRHLTFFLKSLGGVYDIFYCLIQNEINSQSRGFKLPRGQSVFYASSVEKRFFALPYSLLLRAILMNRCDIILSGENVDKDRRYSRQVVDSRVAFIYTQVDAF